MAPRQTTPAGDALIADELARAALENGAASSSDSPADPPPPDVPLTAEEGTPDEPAKPRRGRPPGSKNTGAGRRSRASKLDEIASAADVAIQRGALLASYVILQAPIPPERKPVYMQDAAIIGAPRGREALVGSLRFACDRNARIEKFCLRMIEASAYTGIGAAVVFGLVLPIAVNHGVFRNVPPALLAMLNDDEEAPFAGAPADAGEVAE
jgi:hypothetical protein